MDPDEVLKEPHPNQVAGEPGLLPGPADLDDYLRVKLPGSTGVQDGLQCLTAATVENGEPLFHIAILLTRVLFREYPRDRCRYASPGAC